MTILNRENDGLPSILITLAGIVLRENSISRDDLLKIAVPLSRNDRDLTSRAVGVLLRWTALGLFVEVDEKIRLSVSPKRGETSDSFLDRLPTVCRRLALDLSYGSPLWPEGGRESEESTGLTADLCRGLSWCLAQDIYSLPSSYAELEKLITEQKKPGRFIFLNDTRWPGLRDWARFLGFANGDDSGFLFDPTEAVRMELSEIAKAGETLKASEFIVRLSKQIPVLDAGYYRIQVEESLRPERWAPPPDGYLSTSLSFALRRLHKQGVLGLEMRADAESRFTLTRQSGRTWESFTHVSLLGELP